MNFHAKKELPMHFLAWKFKYWQELFLIWGDIFLKFWNTVMSVLFLPLMEIRDKDWNFYLGLEIVVHRVIFFFPNPFDSHFPYTSDAVAKFVSSGYEKMIEKSRLPIWKCTTTKNIKPSVTNLKTKKNFMRRKIGKSSFAKQKV